MLYFNVTDRQMIRLLLEKLTQLHTTNKQNDLLGLMLCFAAILHTGIIFGVGFTPEDRHIGKVLDVTIASFKDDQKPEAADFIAQEDQQGSGTEEKALMPSTTSHAEFQALEVNPAANITPPSEQTQKPVDSSQSVLVTKTKTKQKDNKETKKEKQDEENEKTVNENELAAKIASLEAQIAQKQQAYAKRPKILQITSAATKKDKGAVYQDDWRKKIEYIGNINYPKEARSRKIYGSLRLLVAIKKDGSLYSVKVLKSSGYPILDRAAIRIVHKSVPFKAFPKELADTDIIEIIRTWHFDRSDKLSTNE